MIDLLEKHWEDEEKEALPSWEERFDQLNNHDIMTVKIIRQTIKTERQQAVKGFVSRLRGDLMFTGKWDEIDEILTKRLIEELKN